MKNPTYEEAVYMVKVKRERAKAALSSVIKRYGVICHVPAPGLEVLLDYFNNMVYGIELLLKVLSEDWGPDGKSRSKNGHNVGAMYEAVFQRQYAASDLMAHLQAAILDQKFIYEPCDTLLDRVPELEALWDELKGEFYRRKWGTVESVVKEIKMPDNFARFLWANIERYYRSESVTMEHRSREQRIQMHEAHIAWLQGEIARLRQSEETLEQENRRQTADLMRGFMEKLASLRSTMHFQLDQTGWELPFGTWTYNATVGDYLG